MKKYLALDLETTGLDPKNDTIIEIAVICFHLEKHGNTHEYIIDDERHMLLDPERPISPEFSLITGIQESLLRGKKTWNEVRESIQDFFDTWQDATLVGQNVQFDIAVLEAHGIHFGGAKQSYTILDTFELAEFLSQDAESLNLSFLCEKYAISGEGAHRAYNDVKMSIELLKYYIQMAGARDTTFLNLLHIIANKTKSGSLTSFLDIIEGDAEHGSGSKSRSLREIFSQILAHPTGAEVEIKKDVPQNTPVHRHILRAEKEQEYTFLETHMQENVPTFLVVAGKEQLQWIAEGWGEHGHECMTLVPETSFIAPEKLIHFIEQNDRFDPKVGIFLMKMCIWLRTTATGNLAELRYYNNEFDLLAGFRTEAHETHFFTERQKATIRPKTLVLIEMSEVLAIDMHAFLGEKILIREPFLLDATIRKKASHHIHFDSLYTFFSEGGYEEESFAVDYIRNILESIPDRPDYSDPPPGEYGETYHFSQETFWCRGGIMLNRAIDTLLHFPREKTSPYIYEMIHALSKISKTEDMNTKLILKIDTKTTLSLIPQNVRTLIEDAFAPFHEIIPYDFGLTEMRMETFFQENIFESTHTQENTYENNPLARSFFTRSTQPLAQYIMGISRNEQKGGIVILVTSKKLAIDIRTMLGNALTDDREILTQGVSGGKEKMLANYCKNPENTILIGLYDTWIQSAKLWKSTDSIFLMKIPFDPPTDIFSLARTIGVANNFMEYNLPTTILKIHTLLSHITLANPDARMTCLDTRLWKNDWGKYIREELLPNERK